MLEEGNAATGRKALGALDDVTNPAVDIHGTTLKRHSARDWQDGAHRCLAYDMLWSTNSTSRANPRCPE